jgi:4'-phosphopantetheinyl transferase
MVSAARPCETGAGAVLSLPGPGPLDAADVAFSIAALDEIALAPTLELLNRAELERAERITCTDYRLQVVKARALLRLLLARLTGAPPESFEFEEGVGRQPRLRVNPWGLHFSVSHSGDRIAVAVSAAPIGIDIERVEAGCGWQAIAETCFHPSESGLLQAAGDTAAASEAFFEIWTRKEAYLKAIGSALDTDPPSFSTAAADGVVLTAASRDFRADVWYTRAIDAPCGYKAALATRRPHPRLVHFQIDGAAAVHVPAPARPSHRRETRVDADAGLDQASAR